MKENLWLVLVIKCNQGRARKKVNFYVDVYFSFKSKFLEAEFLVQEFVRFERMSVWNLGKFCAGGWLLADF